METNVIELPNGLCVLHRYVPYTRTVHCGYVIDTGSRDDLLEESGMTHFIEHMVFKGTVKRKTFHILNYLESVGGDLNAYTTKEKICLYASMVSDYFERATELLTDIVFNSTYPEKEIVKEKQVISEEISMYRNAPDEAIFEDFDKLIFPNHSLGAPILGTRQTIQRFNQHNVVRHVRQNFTQHRIVLSIVGNVSLKRVKKAVDKYLADIHLPTAEREREAPPSLSAKQLDHPIQTEQAHEIIGGRAFGLKQSFHVPFILLNNMLGGPGMNSRLNLNIREKHGLTYSINSFYSPYQDSGIWGIYFACEPGNLQRIRKMVYKELKELTDKPLGQIRLNQAKKQLIGQFTLGYENLLNQMLGMAKDMLDYQRIQSFSSFVEEIELISAAQLQEVAKRLFVEEELSRLTYKQVG
ncbi:MAG: pitrilysin family protein [Bacteroidota bacterium]